MTTATNVDEDGIGDKLQQLIKALMVTMDDEDDCLAKGTASAIYP
jgi:hypothetical protein